MIGRWITRDPMGYEDGGSLYQMVRSSPVMGLDPWGYADAYAYEDQASMPMSIVDQPTGENFDVATDFYNPKNWSDPIAYREAMANKDEIDSQWQREQLERDVRRGENRARKWLEQNDEEFRRDNMFPSFWRWAYAGDWKASDELYDAAVQGSLCGFECATNCIARENLNVYNWLIAGSIFTVAYRGIPTPIAEFLVGENIRGQYFKSGLRVISIWLKKASRSTGYRELKSIAKIFNKEANLFKRGKLSNSAQAARVGAFIFAAVEVYIAQKCARECM